MSLFKSFRKSTDSLVPAHFDDVVGVFAIDADGNIVYANEKAREILLDLSGRSRLPRELAGIPLEEILRKPLSQTVIGRTLLTGNEVKGQRVAYGSHHCIVTTRLIRDEDSNPIGCVQYVLEVDRPDSEDQLHVSQSFTRSLADKLGYSSTEWIDNISLEHSQQLIRCLCNTDHTVPITDYCPYKFQCAFNPRYGWDSLDRRNYLRVPIELAVETRLLELASNKPVPGDIKGKPVPGTTFDLSPRGTGLRCPVKLPLNSIIQIDFYSIEKQFTCEGEIVWQRQDNDGSWLTGVSFLSVSPETSATIIALINKQQLRLWGKPTPRRRQLTGIGLDGLYAKYAIATLRNLLRAKNEALLRHSLRVATTAELLGTAMNLSDRQLALLNYAALLHDLGWLELDLSLLNKETLTEEERAQVQSHCIGGANLVRAIPALEVLAPIIHHHHEYYDGSGYPDQLKGKGIPLLSRIICVADSVDAMLHPLFDTKMSLEQVVTILAREAGGRYDPVVAETCIRLIKSNKLMNAV